MFKRKKGQIKMHAFQQCIRSQQTIFFTYINYRCIIADTSYRVRLCVGNPFIYSLNQPEFTQAANFCSAFHAAKLDKKSEATSGQKWLRDPKLCCISVTYGFVKVYSLIEPPVLELPFKRVSTSFASSSELIVNSIVPPVPVGCGVKPLRINLLSPSNAQVPLNVLPS